MSGGVEVRPTEDGHHVVINGRRWRATDPGLTEEVAAVLRRELMSARRAVGVATRAADERGERAARDRVQAAKVALGERGTPWWEQDDDERQERWRPLVDELRLQDAILELVNSRDTTVCPSEVARKVGGEDWRPLMEPTRAAARKLVEAGRIEITQHGEAVDPAAVKGPVRLRRATT